MLVSSLGVQNPFDVALCFIVSINHYFIGIEQFFYVLFTGYSEFMSAIASGLFPLIQEGNIYNL